MPPKDRLNYGVKWRCPVSTDSSSSAPWEACFTGFDSELSTFSYILQEAGVKKRTQKSPHTAEYHSQALEILLTFCLCRPETMERERKG